jgi:hypothetical protein
MSAAGSLVPNCQQLYQMARNFGSVLTGMMGGRAKFAKISDPRHFIKNYTSFLRINLDVQLF